MADSLQKGTAPYPGIEGSPSGNKPCESMLPLPSLSLTSLPILLIIYFEFCLKKWAKANLNYTAEFKVRNAIFLKLFKEKKLSLRAINQAKAWYTQIPLTSFVSSVSLNNILFIFIIFSVQFIPILDFCFEIFHKWCMKALIVLCVDIAYCNLCWLSLLVFTVWGTLLLESMKA